MAYERIRYRFNIIGNQREGKSYWFGKMAKLYMQNQGSVLVYNYQGEDFPDYTEIRPFDFYDMEDYVIGSSSKTALKRFKRRPYITHFWHEDKNGNKNAYHFADFNRIFCGHGVKMAGLNEPTEDRALMHCFTRFISCCWIGIDDGAGFYNYGLKKEHRVFFQSSDHHGGESTKVDTRKKGFDSAIMWHHPDHVNEAFWTYCNRTILFKVSQNCTLEKIRNPSFSEIMNYCIDDLRSQPDYYYYEINNKTLEYELRQPI